MKKFQNVIIALVLLSFFVVTVNAASSRVATPVLSPGSGTYNVNINVTISCPTSGAVINYTTNGSEPTFSSQRYIGPIVVTSTRKIKAKAFKYGMTESFTASATYNISAAPPQITSITGYSDGVGVKFGRWTGQPSRAPQTASNKYKGFLASDVFNYGSIEANPYFWDIEGKDFGTSTGSVNILPSVGMGPMPFSIYIVSWSNTLVRVKVRPGLLRLTSMPIRLQITTATGAISNTFADNVVKIIKSRGYGQCTCFVAEERIANGRAIPPTAYSTTGTIPGVGQRDNGYRPEFLDCLTYNTNHVAIITSTPISVNNPDGTITVTFTVSEFNATWNEALSQSQRQYKLSKLVNGQRTVLHGIGTNASTTWYATGYYR